MLVRHADDPDRTEGVLIHRQGPGHRAGLRGNQRW